MRDRHSGKEVVALRVLLMDDEERIRDVAGRMFRYLGHEFETAIEGGFEAAIMIREINDDAIILVSSGNTVLVSDDERFGRYFSGALQKPYTVEDIQFAMEYYRPAGDPLEERGNK